MLASVVTGQYCRVHQLLFISSLQEWLSFSPAHLAHAFSDVMQVVESPLSPVSGDDRPPCKSNFRRCMHRPGSP